MMFAGSRSGYIPFMADIDSVDTLVTRIRHARDLALDAERTERTRLGEADNADLQRAASVRLATRQSVREALDDILDESSDPEAD